MEIAVGEGSAAIEALGKDVGRGVGEGHRPHRSAALVGKCEIDLGITARLGQQHGVVECAGTLRGFRSRKPLMEEGRKGCAVDCVAGGGISHGELRIACKGSCDRWWRRPAQPGIVA